MAGVYCKQYEEYQYLELVRKILDEGIERPNRTGIPTKSIFGAQMRYSLGNNKFSLLTTKRVYWKVVLKELIWFIKGCTDGDDLLNDNVKIWRANGTREYLDSRGLYDRAINDLGPIYGFQWRHAGAEYTDHKADYTSQGVDQLHDCIMKIKNNPNDRTIIISAWNVKDLKQMALEPCHCLVQFYVADGKLSCQMYQRSADMGLGVPFNIASYELLTIMIAHVTGLKPGDFIHTIGDAHVYTTHEDALRVQLSREPRPFPTITISRNVTDIDDFKVDDFSVQGYDPHPAILMDMAV